MPCSVIFCRINVCFAAGKQHGVAALDQLHDFRSEFASRRDADRFASGHFNGLFVLRKCARGVFGIAGVRNWDGDARKHGKFVH